MLFNVKDINYNSIREFQEKYIKRAFITEQENYELDSLGLRSRMPDNWDSIDAWARHKKAKIKHAPDLPISFTPELVE